MTEESERTSDARAAPALAGGRARDDTYAGAADRDRIANYRRYVAGDYSNGGGQHG